jgi:hypothetical protein
MVFMSLCHLKAKAILKSKGNLSAATKISGIGSRNYG